MSVVVLQIQSVGGTLLTIAIRINRKIVKNVKESSKTRNTRINV